RRAARSIRAARTPTTAAASSCRASSRPAPRPRPATPWRKGGFRGFPAIRENNRDLSNFGVASNLPRRSRRYFSKGYAQFPCVRETGNFSARISERREPNRDVVAATSDGGEVHTEALFFRRRQPYEPVVL